MSMLATFATVIFCIGCTSWQEKLQNAASAAENDDFSKAARLCDPAYEEHWDELSMENLCDMSYYYYWAYYNDDDNDDDDQYWDKFQTCFETALEKYTTEASNYMDTHGYEPVLLNSDIKVTKALDCISSYDYGTAIALCNDIYYNAFDQVDLYVKCDMAVCYSKVYEHGGYMDDFTLGQIRKCFQSALKDDREETISYLNTFYDSYGMDAERINTFMGF